MPLALTSTPAVPASSSALPAPRPATGWLQSTFMVWVGAVTIMGLGIRAVLLDRVPLWSDEAFMGVLMRRSLTQMIDIVHNDNHPPLQYLLDRVASLVGDTPANLRLPSVLAGTAAVPLAALLGRRIGGDRAGIASGAIVAFMPLLVLWSRDARMYALAVTMVLAMALALWRAAENPSAGRLAVYGATVTIALYTHYVDALAVPTQLVAVALFLRPPRATLVRLGAVAFAGGLALLPWVLYAAPQFRHAGQPYWDQPLRPLAIPGEVAALLAHPGPKLVVVLGTVVGSVLVAIGGRKALRAAAPAQRQGMLYLLGSGGMALALLAAVSLFKPLFDERFSNLFTTELLPFAGAALAWTGRRAVVAAAILALAGITTYQLVTLPTPDVPGAMAPLGGRVDPTRDVVAVNGPWRYFQVLYYGDPATRQATRVVAATVPWYDGLAGFRPGDIIPAVPDVPGTVYLVTDPGQQRPEMPPNLHLSDRHCATGSCVETWRH